MVRKCLFFVLLFITMAHFLLGKEIDHYKEIQSQKHKKVSSSTKEKDFYVTPRIGFSTLTGLIGIELQYKHFAFNIGDFMGTEVKHCLTYGIKYYFKSHHSTWYFGLGGGTALDEFIGENNWRQHIGFILGYRWRWGKGWDFNLGIGPLFPIDKNVTHPPMFDLAFGYSF